MTDATSGLPRANVEVAVTAVDETSYVTTTDTQGRYSIAGMPSATYQVTFRPDVSDPDAPAPARHLIVLSAPSRRHGFDVTLVRGGGLSGRVTDPGGAPIRDARLEVSDGGASSIYGYTTADGSYTIPRLPGGRYRIAFTHDDYQERVLPDLVTVVAPTSTALAATVLNPGGSIAGKVTDPDGNPAANVVVSVLDAATGKSLIAQAFTGSNGLYKTPATLPSGSYIVKFQPPLGTGGCHLAIEFSGNAATAAGAARVQVSAPQTMGDIDAALDYGGLIAGQLSDAVSGLPLSGTLQVYDSSGAVVTTGSTSYLGRYRTQAGLPAGSYRIRFMADGYVPMFYGGATVLEAAAGVPGGSLDINMALARGATVRGRITAADNGAPLEHAAVTLYDVGGREVSTQMTAYDGSYQFWGQVPSGQYRIGAAPGQWGPGEPYFTGYEAVFAYGARSLTEAQPISLVAPSVVTLNLAMPVTSPTLPPSTPTPLPTPPGEQRLYLPLLN